MAQSLPSDICFLCLSRDRKIFCLSASVKYLFGFLTDWYPQTDARVCWECRAILERLRRFKEQAKQAVCALERARIGLQPMSFECLSKVYGTQMLFIDLLVYDDANATDEFSVDTSKNKLCNEYKVEVEFEDDKPRIKGEIAEEIDLGANSLYEKAPNQIAGQDNDIGTKFETINLTEDNTGYAIQNDMKNRIQEIQNQEINLPMVKLQINASSSAEGEIASKNIENCSVIKKSQRVVKTTIKRKKPTVRRIRRRLTAAQKLINKERREEQQKYEMYQQGKAFECDHCGKKFETRPKILVHMRIHFKKIMCDQCAYRGPDQWTLKKHMLAHLDPSHRPHKCEVCEKRFIDKYKLLVHTRSHTGERPFKCDNCGMTFTCKEALTCHIKERHIDRDTLVIKRFSQPRTKSYYMNAPLVHSKDSVVSRPHKSNYKDIKHKNVIPCAECNKTFKWKSQLTHHVNIVHRGERPYQCNICGARSTTKSLLQIHMALHSNEKPFKCDECSATFKHLSGLWSHKFIHKGEKPHQCDICEARFTLKANLVRHMKVHTVERPFECDICTEKFPLRRNLKNHLKTHLQGQQ